MRIFAEMNVSDVVRLVRPMVRDGKTQAQTCDIVAKTTDIYFGNAGLNRDGTPKMSKHAWAVYCIDKAINRMFSQETLVYQEAMREVDLSTNVEEKKKFEHIAREAMVNVKMLAFSKPVKGAAGLNELKRQQALETHAQINVVRAEEGIATPVPQDEYIPEIPAAPAKKTSKAKAK